MSTIIPRAVNLLKSRRHSWVIVTMLAVVVHLTTQLVSGCAGDNKTNAVSQMVTVAQGGTLQASNQQVQLTVAPNALSSNTELTLKVSGKTNQTLSAVYDFGPDGTQFKVPATLSMQWPKANDPTVTLAEYVGGAWVPLQNVRWESGQLLGDVSHFSSFAAVAKSNPSKSCDPTCTTGQTCQDGTCVPTVTKDFCDLSAKDLAGTYSLNFLTAGYAFVIVILADGTVTFSGSRSNTDVQCATNNTTLCNFKMTCVEKFQGGGSHEFTVEFSRDGTKPSLQGSFCSFKASALMGSFSMKVQSPRMGNNDIKFAIDKDGNTTQTGQYLQEDGSSITLNTIQCQVVNENLCSYKMTCTPERDPQGQELIEFKKE